MVEDYEPRRRLAAIVALDVVGYSRKIAADDAAARRLFNTHLQEVLAPSIASRGGRIVKTMGDGLLAEFASVVEAVGCAEGILVALIDRNAERAEADRFELRIGVNLGDVIVEGDDIHGDGVNIAARLEAIAEPGTVYLTEEVHRQVAGRYKSAIAFVGTPPLKSIDRAVSVYRLDPTGDADPARFRSGVERPPATEDRPSIAVLPFRNRSDNTEDEYFAEGVAEEILTALSHVGWLFVIARATSFAFATRDREPREIAAELGVGYILDGTVRRAESRVRITAELADCDSSRQLWSTRYDREMTDIFEIQDEISSRIVGEIQPELARSEQERARRKKGRNLQAWDLCQQAMWHTWRRTREDLSEALRLFAAARVEDPNFVQPLAGEAEALSSMFVRGYTSDSGDALGRAEALARRAVELDPRDAYGHYSLGYTLMFLRRHGEAEPELRHAIDINPNFTQAFFHLGNVLSTSGRSEEGCLMIEQAMQLSPRDPLIGQMMTRYAEALLFSGRHDEALAWSRKALQQPNIQPSRWTTLLAILGTLGRLDEAMPAMDALRRLDPDHDLDFVRSHYPIVDSRSMNKFQQGLIKAGLT